MLIEIKSQQMKKTTLFTLGFALLASLNAISQTIGLNEKSEDGSSYQPYEIRGLVIDLDKQTVLPYTNIYVLHKNTGTISNEIGHFTLNISGLSKSDTVRFQYVGYKTKKITIGELETSPKVYLKEEIINLSEFVVFATDPNVEEIVKNVLKNKDKNYRPVTIKRQTFIRDRDIADFNQIEFNYKKSSIDELDREMIALAEEKIPRNFTSYTDFLGYLYFSQKEADSSKFKIEPIRTVRLKEQDVSDLMQFAKIFEKAFDETGEDEYWKVKSGIFGQKLDSTELKAGFEEDSLDDNQRELAFYRNSIRWKLGFSNLGNKDEWEFLHSTGKYNYTLAGGTRVSGESVYIIDFKPKRGGLYQGRMFISMETYALIRADYEYAPDKTGTDFHLLGVGYTESAFSGSIYFEKKDDNYLLKYFSKRTVSSASFDRNIALLKKKKRWLFDKTLKELKIGLELKVDMSQSIEFLMLSDEFISEKQFAEFKQKEYLEIIFVDQFDDNLWKDFSIIEPTEQMREYKKQAVN
jgi:hypothetical protein